MNHGEANGGEKLQLSTSPISVDSCEWSPDGREIIMAANEPGQRVLISILSREGGMPRPLNIGKWNLVFPSWTPDGNSIVLDKSSGPGHSNMIRSVNLKTGTSSDNPAPDNVLRIALSPDGQYIAAPSVEGDQLLLFNFKTQRWTPLASTSVGSMRGSAESKYVYFENGSSAAKAIFRVRLKDQRIEKIVALKDFCRALNPWITWFGLTPDGSPLLMRDTGTQEAYALDIDIP